MPRSVSSPKANNKDKNRQPKTSKQAIEKSAIVSINAVNTEQLNKSCDSGRRRVKKVVNPVIESGNVCHRKSERRRIARDIFLVFEEQSSRRRRSGHSKRKSTAKVKPKFGHLNLLENPVKPKTLLQDIKNEPKCYVNNNNINKTNNINNNNYKEQYVQCQNTCTNVVDVKFNIKSASSSVTLPSSLLSPPLSSITPIAKVNPIFLWTKQDDTRIVEVRCEDYDKRNRIRLTKTANGNWRSIPCTDPTSTKVVRLYSTTTPLTTVKCENAIKRQQQQQQQPRNNELDLLSNNNNNTMNNNNNNNNNDNNNNDNNNNDNTNCVVPAEIKELVTTSATSPSIICSTEILKTSDTEINGNLIERKSDLNSTTKKRSKKKGNSRKRKCLRNTSPNLNNTDQIEFVVDNNIPLKIRNINAPEFTILTDSNLPIRSCDNKAKVEINLSPPSTQALSLYSNDQKLESTKSNYFNTIHSSNENYELALSIVNSTVTSISELIVPSIVNTYQTEFDDFNVQLCPKTGLFIPAIIDNNNIVKLKNHNGNKSDIISSDTNDEIGTFESEESSKGENKIKHNNNDGKNKNENEYNNQNENKKNLKIVSAPLECLNACALLLEYKNDADDALMMSDSLEAKTKNLKDLLDSADLLDHCDIANGHGNHEELIESLVKTSCGSNLISEHKNVENKEQQKELQERVQEQLQLLQHQGQEQSLQVEEERSEAVDRLILSASDLPKCLSFNEAGEIDFFQSNTCTEPFEKSPTTTDSIIFHDTTEAVLTPKKVTPIFSLLNFDDDAPKDLSNKKRNNKDVCCQLSESSSQCAVTSSSDIMKSPTPHGVVNENLSFTATSSDSLKNTVFEELLKFNSHSMNQKQQQSTQADKLSSEPIDLGKRKLINVSIKESSLCNLIEQVIVEDDDCNVDNGNDNNHGNCNGIVSPKDNNNKTPIATQSIQTSFNINDSDEFSTRNVDINENFNEVSIDIKNNMTTTTLINEDPDPYTQLQLLLSNTQWKLPDPILVPKDRLGAVLASPAREIPLLITTRPELKLPEAFAYPEIIQNPNILVISMAQLEAILKNKEVDKSKTTNITTNLHRNDECVSGESKSKSKDGVTCDNGDCDLSDKTYKSQITAIVGNINAIETEKVGASIEGTVPSIVSVADSAGISLNNPHNLNANLKSNQSYLNTEANLDKGMNASTLAVLNQMFWLPYFGQLSQDIVKAPKLPTPLTMQHLQSFLPFYNAQASFKHLDNIYKNYWKQQQDGDHTTNVISSHQSRLHSRIYHTNATIATTLPTATTTDSLNKSTMEKEFGDKQRKLKLVNGFDNNCNHNNSNPNFDTMSNVIHKEFCEHSNIGQLNSHSQNRPHLSQDSNNCTINIQQQEERQQSHFYKDHHRQQTQNSDNQYVLNHIIEEKNANIVRSNRLGKLNECAAAIVKTDVGNDKKPRLTCKSLANLLDPEYTHHNDLIISSDNTVKTKNLLQPPLRNGYRINHIANDAIVGGNTLTSSSTSVGVPSTNIKRSLKRSNMEKFYMKQTRCGLDSLNVITAGVTTNQINNQSINRTNDNPMLTASDISTPLWHPLFGSNSKSEYYSPWQWTTVTATGE